MDSVNLWLDPYLITLFRFSGYALADFLVGTFLVGLLTVMVGAISSFLAAQANGKFVQETTDEMKRYEGLSVKAAQAGDVTAFHAANKLSNDAFGRSFFQGAAVSAAFIWPVFFALDWMRFRFSEVDFPVLWTPISIGYFTIFAVLYVAAYLVFQRVRGVFSSVKSGSAEVHAVAGEAQTP
jgi:hypothetical protein